MQKIIALYDKVFALAGKAQPLVVLLGRISVGLVFVQSGWGKLHNLEKVTEYFVSLGVPAPHIQAPFVATTELVCGALVLFGLLTRLASIPLVLVMMVAIATAKRAELEGVTDLFGLAEYLYILVFLFLIVEGAGPLSLDRLLRR